jgi:ferredoxin
MPDPSRKVPDNVPGPFYVDEECIDCDLCREIAPESFERNEDEAFSYVHAQPETDAQRDLCREAMENCPVEAIGDDGAAGGDGENGAGEAGGRAEDARADRAG